MEVLLHTIALEPARWTPQRISRNLVELLPKIAAAGFQNLEVFEPHITLAPDRDAVKAVMEEHGLEPVVLSSYLQLNPDKTDDGIFAAGATQLLEIVREFGFRKVRIFPGNDVQPSEGRKVAAVVERIGRLANLLPDVQILLETHDHSLADDPKLILEVVDALQMDNVGLLWQPLAFDETAAWRQWRLQRDYVRHIHLQNRWPDFTLASLGEGAVKWSRILREANCSASLEFVPTGMRPVEIFDLEVTLRECVSEAEWAEAARL